MVYFAPLLRTTKLLYNRLNGNSTYYQGLAGRTFGFESPRKEGRSGAYDGCLACRSCSLVKRCVAENDAAVVSVFVNPTQFNDKNDLVKYPRTPELTAVCWRSVERHLSLHLQWRRCIRNRIPAVSAMRRWTQ